MPKRHPADLPDGTVTFLFTDVEGSTRLAEREAEAMRKALRRHDALLTAGISGYGGLVVKSRGEGDSFFAVFRRATEAVQAAAVLQLALQAEAWPTSRPLRVRMALHTGEAELRDGDYYGTAVNRCARLRASGHGGQVLLSGVTAALVRDELPSSMGLRDLGTYWLRDLTNPEWIFQLLHEDLPHDFPSLRGVKQQPFLQQSKPAAGHGDEQRVAAPSEEAQSLLRELGDGLDSAWLLGLGGSAAPGERNPERARAWLEESLALLGDLGERWGLVLSIHPLGRVAREASRPARDKPKPGRPEPAQND